MRKRAGVTSNLASLTLKHTSRREAGRLGQGGASKGGAQQHTKEQEGRVGAEIETKSGLTGLDKEARTANNYSSYQKGPS